MSARFAAGVAVTVVDRWPEADGPVHVRTPHYVRGKAGRVERCLGAFPNPEDLAFARPAATIPLYHVRFAGDVLWAEGGGDLLVEVFEHWLEPA